MTDYEKKHEETYSTGLTFVEEFKDWAITSADQAAHTDEALKDVLSRIKAIEDERKAITGDLNQALKKTNTFFRKVRTPYEELRDNLKQALLAWDERLETEKQVAKQLLLEDPPEDPEQLKALVEVSGQAPQHESGIKVRKTWDFEVTDMSLVPDEYKTIDSAAVRGTIKVSKGHTQIPGIRVFQKKSISG